VKNFPEYKKMVQISGV